jgi:hypothetical protein
MMDNGIELFDSRGKLRPLVDLEKDVAALGEDGIARFAAVRTAATAVEESERQLKAAEDEVRAAVARLNDAREALKLARPQRTFNQEWRETLRGG